MDHREVGRLWDANADAWTELSRAGYDVYRDHLNTPAFLAMLPDVNGLRGLDLGCGEGHNTRLLAERGARMRGIDISPRFIGHARAVERERSLGIAYQIASAVELPFTDRAFDFCTAFMSLMDIPENEGAIAEACRVLRPGGFLQFSITHPCFDTPRRRLLRDPATRLAYAVEVGGHFATGELRVDEWLFRAAGGEGRPAEVPRPAVPPHPQRVAQQRDRRRIGHRARGRTHCQRRDGRSLSRHAGHPGDGLPPPRSGPEAQGSLTRFRAVLPER